jgi:hypothetical protein
MNNEGGFTLHRAFIPEHDVVALLAIARHASPSGLVQVSFLGL